MIRKNNPGLIYLIQFWQQYYRLDDWHVSWAKQSIQVKNKLNKGTTLFYGGQSEKTVYLVARGMLAMVSYDEDGNRSIHRVAMPGMAVTTTQHLHSKTPIETDIVVLKPNTLIIEISYKHILQFKEQEPGLNTLVNVLISKKKKQISKLLYIMREPDSFARYLLFAQELPLIASELTQVEQAELLNISRSTVQRAQHYLLKGKRP